MAKKQHLLCVETLTGNYTLYGRPCEISAFSFVPAKRNEPGDRTVFNSIKKERKDSSTYDRLFRMRCDFNEKLHRDDREHAKARGLHVNDEEQAKSIPTLTSSEYGHRVKNEYDKPEHLHIRIGYVQSEFYRRNGIQ